MAIVTNTVHKVYIPHECSEADGGPHWVEIRNLSGSELDEAQRVTNIRIMDEFAHLMKDLPKPDPDEKQNETAKNSLESRRQSYDPNVMMKHALVGWSYGALPENPGAVLDAITRDWLWSLLTDENTRPPLLSLSGEPSLS